MIECLIFGYVLVVLFNILYLYRYAPKDLKEYSDKYIK